MELLERLKNNIKNIFNTIKNNFMYILPWLISIILSLYIIYSPKDIVYKEVEKLAKENNLELFKISAATGEGIKELMTRVSELLKELPKEELIEETEERVVYTLKEDKDEFDVEVIDGEYIAVFE